MDFLTKLVWFVGIALALTVAPFGGVIGVGVAAVIIGATVAVAFEIREA